MDNNNNKNISLDEIEIEEICDENDLFTATGGKEERLFWAWSSNDDR